MNTRRLATLSLLLAVLMSVGVLAVQPFGAGVTEVNSTRALADTAGNHSALAGNVTEITVTGFSTTQTWQGYFGNVSGTVQLADSADNVMYNWSLASPEGEIYASEGSSVEWTSIQCLNFTAAGTFADDSAQAGATSLYGLNLTQIETSFTIVSDDVDGLDETFSLDGSHESGENFEHDLFYSNNLLFSIGECLSTTIFDTSGSAENNTFEEVLLYDPTNQDIVFAAILEEPDTLGFDDKNHDFEMLVLEDGHGVDTSTTLYYFYVELE